MSRKRRAFKRDQEARPSQILDAAFDVFAHEGFAAARVEDIARKAGVTKGLVYFYFKSKEELFKAVVRDSVRTPAAPDRLLDAKELNVSAVLEQWLNFFYSTVASNPRAQRLLRVMIAEGDRFPEIREFYFREIIAPVREFMTKLIKAGVRRGQLNNEVTYPQLIMGPALAFSLWQALFNEFAPIEPERYAREHLEFVLRGLGVRHAKRWSRSARER